MKVTNVSVESYRRGIPLKGWDSVKAALNLHANGRTKGSRATEEHQIQAIADSHGAMGLGIYMLGAPHMQGAGNQFVDNMLKEAKSAIRRRDRWARSYDYNGVGTFFKTSVEIIQLDKKEDLYLLEIYAAYVGDKPEVGLAEELGIPRALRRYTVLVQVKPEDATHFAFDFEKVLRTLDGVLKTKSFKGKDIAQHFMSGDQYRDPKHALIYSDTEIFVTVGPGRVEKRFVYDEPGKPRNTWSIKGSVLSGLLDTSYEDLSKKEPPTIVLTVSNAAQDRSGRNLPIWDINAQDKIDILANEIAEAMNNV